MVKEEVDEDDVAAVVARWTGIPVERLLEGETEKLIHMEERLHDRAVAEREIGEFPRCQRHVDAHGRGQPTGCGRGERGS